MGGIQQRIKDGRISKHSDYTKRDNRQRNRAREKNRRQCCKIGWKR